jgi:hypothetical protein
LTGLSSLKGRESQDTQAHLLREISPKPAEKTH